MADDLARLGIEWVPQGATEANAALEKTAEVAPAAEKATDAFAASQKRAATATQQFQKTMQRTALDLSRQFADVGVSLAMGLNPFMILIQQGPQIADALQVASTQGVSFGDAMKGLLVQLGVLRVVAPAAGVANDNLAVSTAAAATSTTAMGAAASAATVEMGAATVAAGELAAANTAVAATATEAAAAETVALAPLALILAGLALTAGAVGAGFAVGAQQINKSSGDLTKGLGLTEKQLDRVKQKTVTMGDTVWATFHVLGDRISHLFADQIAWVKKTVSDAYQAFIDGTNWTIGTILGAFVGGFKGIKATWTMLPAALGDVTITAANFVIHGVETMLNAVLKRVNALIEGANHLAEKVGLDIHLSTFTPAHFDELPNRFKGMADKAAGAWNGAWKAGMAEGRQAWSNFLDDIGDAARKHRIDKILDEAGDAAKARSSSTRAHSGADENPLTSAAKYLSGFKVDESGLPEFVDQSKILGAEVDAEIERVTKFAEAMDDTARRVSDAAGMMASAFGPVGAAIGGLMKITGDYGKQKAQIAARDATAYGEYLKIVQNETSTEADKHKAFDHWNEVSKKSTQEERDLRVKAYGDALDAATGFFEKGSDGYRFMQAASAAYHAFEAAQTLQSMILDATKTASSVANSATRATADTAAGGAKMFSQLGVYAFPAVAAMIAVMASLGATSGGSAGSMPGAHDAEDRQARQGTGSILGDAKAKSDSIAHSLEIVASNTNHDLEYSNQMLKALRSIDNQIGAVAAAVGRSLGVGGTLDTSNLNLGTSVQGPSTLQKFLNPLSAILPGLFGSKTTNTLQDLGVQFSPETIGSIIASGINGNTYQQVATEKKKKFLGITYSDKTRVNTTTGALDPDFIRQTQLLISSLRDGVVEAASVLGVQGAKATLDSFTLNLGKMSFKDMSADEIQTALENVFSKAADDMAHAVLPMLSQFQKAGEGQFETLTRVAREYQVVDVAMQSIGKTFGSVGVGSIAARDRLVQLMGGLDDFTSATSAYADAFLTDTDKLGPVRTAVATELARLGLSDIKTRDQFKSVVQGLDLTTQAGAEMYASLMNLAPAFAKATEETKALTDARSALSEAYDRESGALQDTIDTFRDLASGLHDYGQSLYNGPAAALSPEEQYKANKAQFEQIASLAATGDKTALGQLQSVSQAYLDASKDYYASSKGYFDDLTTVRDAVQQAEAMAGAQVDVAQAQLDQMTASVGQLIDLNKNVLTVAEAIANLQAATEASAIPAAPIPVVVTQPAPQQTDTEQQRLTLLQQLLAQGGASQQQIAAIAAQNVGMLGNIANLLARLNRQEQNAA